jgi:hypothetical protein
METQTKIWKPRLVNAKKMANDAPESFHYWEDEIKEMKVGDYVKICDGYERFWTTVVEIDGDTIIATVSNVLLGDKMNYKDLVSYKKYNIYEVWDKQEYKEMLEYNKVK